MLVVFFPLVQDSLEKDINGSQGTFLVKQQKNKIKYKLFKISLNALVFASQSSCIFLKI